jgi:hypothetical protein
LAAKSKRDALENRLNQVRSTGTPEEKLAASHDFVSADQALKQMDRDGVASDPAVKESMAAAAHAVALADEDLRRKNEDLRRKNEELRAKAREEYLKERNSPNNVAAQSGKIIPGMTKVQVEGDEKRET